MRRAEAKDATLATRASVAPTGDSIVSCTKRRFANGAPRLSATEPPRTSCGVTPPAGATGGAGRGDGRLFRRRLDDGRCVIGRRRGRRWRRWRGGAGSPQRDDVVRPGLPDHDALATGSRDVEVDELLGHGQRRDRHRRRPRRTVVNARLDDDVAARRRRRPDRELLPAGHCGEMQELARLPRRGDDLRRGPPASHGAYTDAEDADGVGRVLPGRRSIAGIVRRHRDRQNAARLAGRDDAPPRAGGSADTDLDAVPSALVAHVAGPGIDDGSPGVRVGDDWWVPGVPLRLRGTERRRQRREQRVHLQPAVVVVPLTREEEAIAPDRPRSNAVPAVADRVPPLGVVDTPQRLVERPVAGLIVLVPGREGVAVGIDVPVVHVRHPAIATCPRHRRHVDRAWRVPHRAHARDNSQGAAVGPGNRDVGGRGGHLR